MGATKKQVHQRVMDRLAMGAFNPEGPTFVMLSKGTMRLTLKELMALYAVLTAERRMRGERPWSD